jgi:hypothetical protein
MPEFSVENEFWLNHKYNFKHIKPWILKYEGILKRASSSSGEASCRVVVQFADVHHGNAFMKLVRIINQPYF